MKRPRKRQTFRSEAAELNYLNDVIQSVSSRGEISSSELKILLRRFHELLVPSGLDDGSIMLQDHWAVFHEASSNFGSAIGHRVREVELIHKLFAIDGPVGPVDLSFLLDKLSSLQRLYRELGQDENSARILELIETTKEM
jgi:hypothetical protein